MRDDAAMNAPRKKSERLGRVYSPDLLWKLERQMDSANQHISLALSMVRKEIQSQGYIAVEEAKK